MIDPAMVRPGRLDKLLYVDLPGKGERVEIVRTLVRGVPLGEEGEGECVLEGVEVLVRDRCEGYSGADLAALVREAGVMALRKTLGALDDMDDAPTAEQQEVPSVKVVLQDFVRALDKVGPSVSVVQRRKYEALRSKFAGLPVGGSKDRGDEESGKGEGTGTGGGVIG
jgi:ribosome biogenesis ATPase